MVEQDENEGVARRAEEFLQVIKKGAEFTQDLLKENERLRYQVLQLEQSAREGGAAEVDRLQGRVSELETEKRQILDRIQETEQANLDFANRYAEIESENNLLANLYISSYQLHSTLEPSEIIRIIQEILLNLIGAERFSIMLLDESRQQLLPLVAEGISLEQVAPVPIGVGTIGQVARTGERLVSTGRQGGAELSEPLVVIPLKVGEEVIGVINVYGLLEQKATFSEIDEELFALLGGHAATAIMTAVLHSEAGGKSVITERNFALLQG